MNFYDLKIAKPNGEILNMSDYKGKTVLAVNTATKCGLTPQLNELEELHQKYKEQGLVIIGFPCNQFLNQEPETNETLEDFCRINHGVTFQLTEKIDVNGDNTHPVFNYLKTELKGTLGKTIKWNFTKFLVDTQGNVLERYAPTTKPEDLADKIATLLK